jgi:hypothetical protein
MRIYFIPKLKMSLPFLVLQTLSWFGFQFTKEALDLKVTNYCPVFGKILLISKLKSRSGKIVRAIA